jgi:ribosomal protein S18 acetylase RimI-like enzyme
MRVITVKIQDKSLEIHPITQDDLDAVLEVYKQCEDFLALGPTPTASIEMVLKDLEISRKEGGIFCGIYRTDGTMIGVLDYVPDHYQGDPHAAYLSLLMIPASYRGKGIGKAIVRAVEEQIRKNNSIAVILAGVQVNNPQAVQFWQRNGYRIVSEPKLMPDQTTVFDLRKDLHQPAAIGNEGSIERQMEERRNEVQ